jgi:immunity protein 26 of polymorphic toxin system
MARQQWTNGAVVRIPLGPDAFGFGQMLESPEYAFFDFQSALAVSVEAVVAHPILFRLWVMKTAHSGGRWTKIGTAPLSEALKMKVFRFNQDPIQPTQIRLTIHGCDGPLVSPSECDGLERAAVWDAEHVEDRLRDHFAGRPNKWVESMKIRR